MAGLLTTGAAVQGEARQGSTTQQVQMTSWCSKMLHSQGVVEPALFRCSSHGRITIVRLE